MNLADIVRYWAREQADSIAISAERDITWSALDRRTSGLAAGLAQRNVKDGDRVAILAENCAEYCELVIALYKLGAIVVPLNVRQTASELAYVLDNAGCVLAVTDETHLAALEEACGKISSGADIQIFTIGASFDSLVKEGLAYPHANNDFETVAALCYTSGTTGFPKGAMLSHGNIWSMSVARILANAMTFEDIGYLPFSLSFTGGLMSVWMPLYTAGATLILHDSYDPVRALETIQDRRVTAFSAVPVIWEQMVAHPRFDEFDLSSLRVCVSGGAPVPLALLEKLQAANLEMAQGYGLTETSGLASLLPPEHAKDKIGSAGRAIMHCDIRVVDDDMQDVPEGAVGEIVVRGPILMKGYWNDEAATEAAFSGGWLRTGDLGTIDADGYITIVDRKKDMLISGGLNVYPAEIERVMAGFDNVVEVAVIGVPDDVWGETPLAIVRASEPFSVDALRDHCRAELGDFKVPKHILRRDEPLPRGMSGKVLKSALREEYATQG